MTAPAVSVSARLVSATSAGDTPAVVALLAQIHADGASGGVLIALADLASQLAAELWGTDVAQAHLDSMAFGAIGLVGTDTPPDA